MIQLTMSSTKYSSNSKTIIKYVAFGLLCLLVDGVNSACFFSPEHQGEFIMQITVNHDNEVVYTHVNVTEESIPIWGECYKRINGSKIILKVDSDDSSCFRCFHIDLAARNVLRVLTSEESRCYTNEEKSIESCPNIENIKNQNAYKEIILYKISAYDGAEIQRQYCPITGRYRFTYKAENEPLRITNQCDTNDSEIDSCPSGSALNIRFRDCDSRSYETTLECLGHWIGYDGRKYMAFVNTEHGEKFGPDYRCAVYDVNKSTGVITITLSSDSSCSIESNVGQLESNMNSSSDHNEMFHLQHPIESPWDHQHNYCILPEALHGEFEYLTINGDQVIFRDSVSFKTYKMKCLELYKDIKYPGGQKDDTNTKVLTLSRTQCGEEQYQCVWINKRSSNIIEFKIGTKTVQYKSYSDSNESIENICDDEYFEKSHWITQGRLDKGYIITSCPINGEFIGYIPDAEGLCAKMWSDCKMPDIMYYEVTACDDPFMIYDERKYQCVGEWSESNVIYTYTRRLDIPTYECFVGALYTDSEIFIKEAGEHCQRDVDPYRYGMQLNQTVACPTIISSIGEAHSGAALLPNIIVGNSTEASSQAIFENATMSNNADISDTSNEITYDFYDEHQPNITQTQKNHPKAQNNSIDSGMVEIINMNRTESIDSQTVNNKVENSPKKATNHNDMNHITFNRAPITNPFRVWPFFIIVYLAFVYSCRTL